MTAPLPAMRFATVRLATGPQLHYAECGASDGDAVLFLHGWPDSWFSFSRVMPLLTSRYRAIALDQRGFGDSERPGCCYSIRDFASDAAAFLDAMSLERATVVGHSFGSVVARRLAIAYPDRVSRLVLIGSGWSSGNSVMRELQTIAGQLVDSVSPAFARDFQASTAHVPLPVAFFERIVAESLKLPATLWSEILNGLMAYDDADQLATIAAPTLLMWGDNDALFSREDQDRLLAAIPGARLSIYDDTGHCPNWERPEKVAADLNAFLQE